MIGVMGYSGMSALWQRTQGMSDTAVRGTSAAASVERTQSFASPAVTGAQKTAFTAQGPAAPEMPYLPEGYAPVDLATRTRVQFPELASPWAEFEGQEDDFFRSLGLPPLGDNEETDFEFNTLPFGNDAEESDYEFDVLPFDDGAEESEFDLPPFGDDGDDAEERFRTLGTPTNKDESVPGLPGDDDDDDGEKKGVEGVKDAKSPAEIMEDSKCETCAKRKYQDGSDDAGVSFKFATRVDPRLAESAVRGHEMEHVVRDRAKAEMEGRKVVSQYVTYHTAICPECGRIYVSGGTTRTVSMKDGMKDFLSEFTNSGEDALGITA